MTPTEACAAMRTAGLCHEDARHYVGAYPPEQWSEIIEWAQRPPGIDACDDVEADGHWA